MKNKLLPEIIIAIVFVGLVIFLLNPLDAWMPTPALMAGIVALLVLFAVFASFVWREHGKDEREDLHIMRAGRFAFIAGSAVLTLGVAVEGLQGQVDTWLAAALGIMILAKVAGLIYGKLNN